MKKIPLLYVFCTFLFLLTFQINLAAQFAGGAVALNESRVIHRSWHLTNLRGTNFILRQDGNTLLATENSISFASTFILEPGITDASWLTADARWFHIRNLNSGQYLTVGHSGALPRSVSLTEFNEASHAQQFRLIATGVASQYKLRSRLSASGPDLVLETNSEGILQADSPKLDPSAEQKFTFNLAMPAGANRRFILCSPGGRFLSDNGIKADGTQAVQKKDIDESGIWDLQYVGGISYRIQNKLTLLYITAPSGSSVGDIPIMTSNPQGDNSLWDLEQTDAFFQFRSKAFPNLFISATNQQSGEPVRLRNSADSYRRWLISEVQGEIETLPGEFERIDDGTLPEGCFLNYGSQFKKALCERVALNPAHSELYFDFIREAISAKMGANQVDEILQKMDLNNSGHRVDLVLMIRYYVSEVLPFIPYNQWSSASQAAVQEIESKITQIRNDYANRLQSSWNDYVQYHGSNISFADLYFFWIDGDGFEWPEYFEASNSEAYLIAEYVSGAASFQEYNSAVVGGAAIGATIATFAVLYTQIPPVLMTALFTVKAPTALAGIAASTTAGAYVAMISGPVLAVAVVAATFIAVQATDAIEFQQFVNTIEEEVLWAQQPIDLKGGLSGNNLLTRLKLLADIDFVFGAPVNGSFQHNTNDNAYLPSFTLSCFTEVTLEMDATGHATISSGQVTSGVTTPLCGSDINYSFSQNQFDCNDMPGFQVTMTAQNDKSTQSCMFMVNLIDHIPPTITCPANQTLLLNNECNAVLTDYRYLATNVTDNCDLNTVIQIPASGTLVTAAGQMTITHRASDVSGNSAECTFTITKIDNTAPTIICPPDQTLILGQDCSASIPDYRSLALADDACGISSIVQLPNPGFIVSGTGNLISVLIVSDFSNNTSQCSYTISKVDQTPPSIQCPVSQALVLGQDCSANLPDFTGMVIASDNCGIGSITQFPGINNSVTNAGNLIVSFTVSDINGNTSHCSFNVVKTDNIAPMVQCSNQVRTFNGEEQLLLSAQDFVVVSDNCGIEGIILSPSVVICQQVGQIIPVLVTVTDINDNSSTCVSQFTVNGLPCGWEQNPDGINCAGGNNIAFNPQSQVWTATSTNCYYASPFTSDASAFAQKSLCGDGSITVQVTGISGTALGWAGVVMRENSEAGAKKAQLTTNMSGNQTRREFRLTANGTAVPQNIAAQNRYWLRIVRSGNQFTLYNSPNGIQWYHVGSQTILMASCIKVGLIASNYSSNSSVTSTFANVTFSGINVPAPQYQGYANPAGIPDQELNFSLYPNPTSAELNIDLKEYMGKNVQIELYSLEGKLMQMIQSDEIQHNTHTMLLDRYSSGMYFVKLKSEGLPDVTKRIVLNK